MSINAVTPAQRAKRALERAEQEAWEAHWNEYEEANEKLNHERFNSFLGWTHGKAGTYKAGCRCDGCRRANTEYMRAYNKKYREANPLPPKPRPKGRGRVIKEHMHGTQTGYAYGCRCDECKAEAVRRKPKPHVNHGTENAYRKGCRCMRCTKAQSLRAKERRKRYQAKRRNKKMVQSQEPQPPKQYKPIPTPQPIHEIKRVQDVITEHQEIEDME